MSSIVTFCGLICNQTELFHEVTFWVGGGGLKTKFRKITLQFLLGMLVYLGYLSQLELSQFELELNVCSANTEVNFLFLAQAIFNENE